MKCLKLFLLEGKLVLRELLYNYRANSTSGVTNPLKYGEVPTSVVTDSVLNNSLIAKLIENGGIKFPTELGDNLNNKAIYILDELGKLFTKDKNAFTIEDKRISLHNWINSVYNNYMETYDIQDAIETDKPIRFVIQNLDGGKDIIFNKVLQVEIYILLLHIILWSLLLMAVLFKLKEELKLFQLMD